MTSQTKGAARYTAQMVFMEEPEHAAHARAWAAAREESLSEIMRAIYQAGLKVMAARWERKLGRELTAGELEAALKAADRGPRSRGGAYTAAIVPVVPAKAVKVARRRKAPLVADPFEVAS